VAQSFIINSLACIKFVIFTRKQRISRLGFRIAFPTACARSGKSREFPVSGFTAISGPRDIAQFNRQKPCTILN
jgi:hypothetical protein